MDEDWETYTANDWDELSIKWFAELDRNDEEKDEIRILIVEMNFFANDKIQWLFIQHAFSNANTDSHLGHLAAGPVEHLLGHHGKDWIDEIESKAKSEESFARLLTGVWKNKTTDDIWHRVEKIQENVENPL